MLLVLQPRFVEQQTSQLRQLPATTTKQYYATPLTRTIIHACQPDSGVNPLDHRQLAH